MSSPSVDHHTRFEDVQALLTGTLFISLAVTLFNRAGLLTGGTAGLAFLLHYATGIGFGKLFFLINLPFYWIAWRRMGRAELFRCSYAAACAASERALHYALRLEDRQDIARSADVLVTALLWGPEPIETAIPRCEQLLAHAHGNDPLRGNVLVALGGLRALGGDFDEARRLMNQAEAIYSDLGLPMHLAGLTEIAGQVELIAGDAAAAEAQLRTGLELLDQTSHAHTALNNAWLAMALVARGRLDEARERAEVARDTASPAQLLTQVYWRSALARVEAAEGNLEVALELARDAVERAAATDGLAMRAESLLDLGAVLTAAGETEEAARVDREAAELYALKGRVG